MLHSTPSVISSAPSHLRLTEAERSELRTLAESLSNRESALVDDPGWRTRVRRSSCRIPVRLIEALRDYRHDSGPRGTLLVTNLPLSEAGLPATPAVPDSVERHATLPATLTMLLGQQLGEVVAYRDEKSGALVQNVVPVRTLAESQSNAGSVALELHTENAFHPHLPDYIGLTCLRNDQPAGTLVAGVRGALSRIDDADQATLRQARYVTEAPPSFRSVDRTEPHPVIDGSPEDPNIRVDFSATTAMDEEARLALQRLRDAMFDTGSVLHLKPGEMVFVDNRVAVHGRSAFAPRYDGQDRWLHRIFIHLDNRRSRWCRAENGPVLA